MAKSGEANHFEVYLVLGPRRTLTADNSMTISRILEHVSRIHAHGSSCTEAIQLEDFVPRPYRKYSVPEGFCEYHLPLSCKPCF